MTETLARTRAELAADYLQLDAAYSDLFNGCSREQLVWRPGDGPWSIAECIEHVARGNSQYLPPIKEAIAKGGPAVPAGDYLFSPGGWFSRVFLKRIGPRITVKFKAPAKIRPLSIDPEQAFQELRRGHAEIQELLAATAELDLTASASRTLLFRFYDSRSQLDAWLWPHTDVAICNRPSECQRWAGFLARRETLEQVCCEG